MNQTKQLALGLLLIAEAAGLALVILGLALYPRRPSLVTAGVAVVVSVLVVRLSRRGGVHR